MFQFSYCEQKYLSKNETQILILVEFQIEKYMENKIITFILFKMCGLICAVFVFSTFEMDLILSTPKPYYTQQNYLLLDSIHQNESKIFTKATAICHSFLSDKRILVVQTVCGFNISFLKSLFA